MPPRPPPYPTHTLPIPPYTQARSFSILIQFSLRLAATPPDDMPTPRPPPTESYVDSRFSEFRRKHKDDRKFLSPSKLLSTFLHGPPPSSLGADSLSLYIYICITLSYLQVGPPCWAPTDPMFLAFNVVCKKFLLSLSYFPVLWKKQMQQTPHTYPVLVLPILPILLLLQLQLSTVSLVLYVPFVSRHVLMLASG